MSEIDWNAAKTEYVTTTISQRALAAKYGVTPQAVALHSKQEEWVEARKQYARKTYAKSIEKASEKESNRLAKLIISTEKAVERVSALFDDPDQFNRHLVETMEEYAEPIVEMTPDYEEQEVQCKAIGMRKWTEERVFTKADTKALKDAVTMLKDLTGLMRNLYGIPTQAEAEAQRVAAERLKLEQKKSDAAENTGGIEVLFSAGEEAWNE